MKSHGNENNKELEDETQSLEGITKLPDSEGEPFSGMPENHMSPSAEKNCDTNQYDDTPQSEEMAKEISTPLPLPQLSKWEREDELPVTPKGLVEKKAPEEERKVTVDIIKRAENAIFSGRGLVSRKVFLDTQKQKEIDDRSPTPDWDRTELREAKRRGPSIQITISSKTESQIGRPRIGRSAPSSPERVDERRPSLKSKRIFENEAKSERHSRPGKRSPSPSETHSLSKGRRKSEKEDKSQFVEEKNISSSQNIVSLKHQKSRSPVLENQTSLCEEPKENRDSTLENTMENINDGNDQKGLKRIHVLPSSDESELKRLKTEENIPTAEQHKDENNLIVKVETEATECNRESVAPAQEIESDVVEKCETREENTKPIHEENVDSISMGPPAVVKDPEELEEGEIHTDTSSEGIHAAELLTENPQQMMEAGVAENEPLLPEEKKLRYSPIRVPTPIQENQLLKEIKGKEKSKKRKKRKRSSSSSSSNSSTSSSSSSSEEEEIIKKKKKKRKKKKKAADSDSSEAESKSKHKKKKKDKKKKKKKDKKKKSEK